MKFKPAIILTVIAVALVGAKYLGESVINAQKPAAPVKEIDGDFEIQPLSLEEFKKLQEELRKQIEADILKKLEENKKPDPPAPSETVGGVSLSTPAVSGVCRTGNCGTQYSNQVRYYYPQAAPAQSAPRRFRLRFWR